MKNKAGQTSMLQVAFSGHSSKGKKAANQDAFAAYLPADSDVAAFKGAAACIADGISGSKHASMASQVACESFMLDYYATPDYWSVKRSASKVIESVNDWLNHQDLNHIDPNKRSVADAHITTFSAMIIKSHTAYIFHVGDSRIYHLKQGGLTQLTSDHSYMQGTVRPHLVRALGIESMVDIDYITVPVKQGDRFLLSTDGIHDALSHQQITTICHQAEQDVGQIAKQLIDAAVKQGEDNASALMVEVMALPEVKTDEIYQNMAALLIPPVLKVGESIDHFSIVRVLEKGARSHVYLAKSQLDEKKYVLKMPSKDYQDDEAYLQGFALEQWVGIRMNHPTLMKIYAQTHQSDFLYHVCEYIEGITLKQWMADRPNLSLIETRAMLQEMIKPVRYMHRNNLLHRDLKPENFIIHHDGTLKLIDYGTVQVASIEEQSIERVKEAPVGDIGYIAPEVLVYGRSSNRSDLFSLACIVYEMLTKELPYAAILSNQDFPKQFDLWDYRPIRQSLQSPPLWVNQVLCKALAPNPKLRYKQLSAFEADLSSPSAEVLQSVKSRPLVEKNPLFFWKALVVVLAIALLAQSLYFVVFH